MPEGEPNSQGAGGAAEALESPDITPEITSWLRELSLSDHLEAVLQWCEEIGAASLDEVVENVEDLAEAMAASLKPFQSRRLVRKASEAFGAVQSSIDVAAAPTPRSASTAAMPGGTSFYTRQSFYTDPAPEQQEDDPHTQREGMSEEPLVETPREESEEEYLKQSPTKCAPLMEGSEEEYLKQSPTKCAPLMVPSTRKPTQGEQKKARHRLASAEADEVDAEEEARQRAAVALQRQLEQEANSKLAHARDDLKRVLESSSSVPGELAQAIEEAVKAGLSHDELEEARQKMQLRTRRHQQKCHNAICALQAALEGAMDETFGPAVRAALEAAALHAAEVEGGDAVVAQARAALETWRVKEQQLMEAKRVKEQQLMEAKMGLQFFLRRGDAQALKIAIQTAWEAGLDKRNSLLAEADEKLKALLDAERLDGEAQQKLERAVALRDLAELEAAVEACTTRRLPLQNASALLKELRAEAKRRDDASRKLSSALHDQDPGAIRSALEQAKAVGVPDPVLEEAEARVAEIEVAVKRRQNAKLELCLAQSARDRKRLEVAIDEGRSVGLDEEALKVAEALLAEIKEALKRREAAREAVILAMACSTVGAINEALAVASGVLPRNHPDVAAAWERLHELEEQERREAEQRALKEAEESLRVAIRRKDWEAICAGREAVQGFGAAADVEVLKLASATLEQLRDAHELEEAQSIVEAVKSRIAALQEREAALQGAAHKKERSAVGKEIMALRGSEEYLSAARFLKDPEAERKRREEQGLEAERRAASERERRECRQKEVEQELQVALAMPSGCDEAEDAVRALLVEGALSKAAVQAAEAFLADRDRCREAAEQNALLVEFSYAGLERRAFFQASVRVNELLTDQYSMQEGADFKLKVVKGSNSVLVAFRSAELARAVLSTAKALSATLGPSPAAGAVSSADVRGPLDFTEEECLREALPGMRQDAELLQLKPQRPESARAAREVARRLAGDAGAKNPAWRESCESPPPPALPGSASALQPSRSVAGKAGAPPYQDRPANPKNNNDGGSYYVGKGKAAGRGGAVGSGGPRTAESASQAAAPAAPESNSLPPPEESIPLPWHAAMLQHGSNKAGMLHNDLQTFQHRFRVAAELRGLREVVIRPPTGSAVDAAAMTKAREELERLLEFYFPRPRQVQLRVDAEQGAGIETTPIEYGYRIDHVEDFPGQDFVPGDVIVEVNDVMLAGLSEEDMEEAFAECFGHGALLTLIGDPGIS